MLKERINIILFMLAVATIGLANLLFPHRGTVSELENRNLATFPVYSNQALFSGRFTVELENFIADHFLMREAFVVWSHDVKEFLKPKTGGESIQIVVNKGANVEDNAALEGEDLEALATEQAAESVESETSVQESTEAVTQTITESKPEAAGEQPKDAPVPEAASPSNAPEGTQAPVAGEAVKEQGAAAPTGTVLTEGSTDSASEVKETAADKQAESKTGSVLIVGNKAMEIYRFNKTSADNYSGKILKFTEGLKDVKVYSLLAPTQIEFVQSEKFKNVSDSQKQGIDHVYGKLDGKVVPVDAYTPLQENRDKYVYFRTDHHWTALGAYYAYTGFCRAAGFEPVPIERYEHGEVTDFLGSLYSITVSKALRSNPDTIHYYKPPVKHTYHIYYEGALKMNLIDLNRAKDKNKYRIFISGDRPMGKVTSENKNGKKILVIKDSYGNAFVPFLVPHYEEVYVIDPRQYKNSVKDLIQKEGIGEVLFVNYVHITNNYAFAKLLDALH